MFSKMLVSAVTATALLSTLPAFARDLKLADFHSPSHFIVEEVYEPFANAVSEATGGDLTVRLYMGGELGPGPNEQYNRAVDGVADIVLAMPGYTASTFPLTLLADLPGVIDAETGTERMLANIDKLSQEYRRVQLLALWNNAPSFLFSATKPIRKLEDLAGMKVRVPSRNAGLVLEAWGGVPVSMPASEVYNAMQTGVIDGAMIDATALTGFRLEEVTNYITVGMDTSISQFLMVMNCDSFQELSEEQQKAVLDAGQEAARNGNRAWLGVASTALKDFAGTEGKEVITLSEEEIEKFNAATSTVVESVIEEVEATGVAARAYVEALQND